MNALKTLRTLICCVYLISCSNHDTVMAPYEEKLGLNDDIQKTFHSMLYFPSGTALHFPGYIVGIEKSPQNTIGGPKFDRRSIFVQAGKYFNLEEDGSNNTKAQIYRFEKLDFKAMYITHIIKNEMHVLSNDSPQPYITNSHCFVYNAYVSQALVQENTDLTKINDWHSCDISLNLDEEQPKINQLYKYGNKSLEKLKDNLSHDISSGSYTHLLIIVMGWNTSQSEAVRNFNDITGNIMAASLEPDLVQQGRTINRRLATKSIQYSATPFRPLVIGVTWPSFWSEKTTNVASYTTKADDADEIGLSWFNKLLNDTVPKAITASGKNLPIIAIGHSFGARTITRALFSSPALIDFPDQKKVTSKVSLAVALQGAVSINRFIRGAGIEGAPYRDFDKLENTQIVLTASSHDEAAGNPLVFWYPPSGSIKTFHKVCKDGDDRNIFNCLIASDTSQQSGPNAKFSLCHYGDDKNCIESDSKSSSKKRKIEYIDTSNGITEFNSPGSGGLAHSDIYRLPMGRLLWKLIQQHAIN